MSTATTGRRREHKVRDHMIEAGWHFDCRAAGSKGAGDLWMSHDEHGGAVVQVGTQGKTLGPAARDRLMDTAERWGALPILARVVPYVGIEYLRVARELSGWERWSP